MKQQTCLTSFWCHLCQQDFCSQGLPGKEVILCPKCKNDFCEVNRKETQPTKYQPYQKVPQKKTKNQHRIDKRIINLSVNELSQIVEVENQIIIELSKETIERLRRKVDREADCVVCKQQLVVGQQGLISQCRHVFHEDCLATWLKIKNSCPTCRQKIINSEQENKENDFS